MTKINKTKIIKKVFVDELEKRGFKYAGNKRKSWQFINDTGEIDLQIIILEYQYDCTLFSFIMVGNTTIKASQLNPSDEVIDEYYKADNDSDFEALMINFLELMMSKGFELLEKISNVTDEKKVSNFISEYIYENRENIYKDFICKYPQVRVDEYSLEAISEWFDFFEDKYTFYKDEALEKLTDQGLKEFEEVATFLGKMLEKHLFGKWKLYKFKGESSVLIEDMKTLNSGINLVEGICAAIDQKDIKFIKCVFEDFYNFRQGVNGSNNYVF